MKPALSDWPRLASSVFFRDAAQATDWLCKALRCDVRLKIEDDGGRIEHSEHTDSGGLVWVSQEAPDSPFGWKSTMRSPQSPGGATTRSIMLFVDDAEAHCKQARACGATIIEELATHDYDDAYWSDRSKGALDLEGHLWWITQRLCNPPAP